MTEIKEMSAYAVENGKTFKTKVYYCQNCNNGDFHTKKFFRGIN
jgi:ribosomal protein S27AE